MASSPCQQAWPASARCRGRGPAGSRSRTSSLGLAAARRGWARRGRRRSTRAQRVAGRAVLGEQLAAVGFSAAVRSTPPGAALALSSVGVGEHQRGHEPDAERGGRDHHGDRHEAARREARLVRRRRPLRPAAITAAEGDEEHTRGRPRPEKPTENPDSHAAAGPLHPHPRGHRRRPWARSSSPAGRPPRKSPPPPAAATSSPSSRSARVRPGLALLETSEAAPARAPGRCSGLTVARLDMAGRSSARSDAHDDVDRPARRRRSARAGPRRRQRLGAHRQPVALVDAAAGR